MNYHIKFNFTEDRKEELKVNVWPVSLAKRIIKAELGLIPSTENSGGDIRYDTEDPAIFLELMKIAFESSGGGWWAMDGMLKKTTVFHIQLV